MTSQYKKNHYVPKTYLKRFTDPSRWNDKVCFINPLNIRDKSIRFNSIDEQCQKKNLYTFPEEFKTEEKKAIEIAFMGHVDSIYSNAMSNSYDKGEDPSEGNLNSIIWFVIYQSFRTPKFKTHHLDKVQELSLKLGKSDSALEEYTYWLGYLLVKASIDIFDNSILEILIAKKDNWFITSDNPAGYWLINLKNSQYVGTILSFYDRTDLKIVCPIIPQIVFLLHLNYLKKSTIKNTTKKFNYFTRIIEKEESELINRMIFTSCDKQIFSIDKEQLKKI